MAMAPCVRAESPLNVAWKNDVIQTLFSMVFFTLYFWLVYDKKFCVFFEILVGHTMKKKR